MKKNLLIALAIGGLMVTSCSEDVYVEPAHESFNKDFTETFGPISADEDWNAFETKSVNVTGDGNDVKVYAKQGSSWACVSTYTAVSGSKNITFEALKTSDSFIVKSGSKAQYVTDGASVNFADSRAIKDDVANVFTKIDYKEFSYQEVMRFASLVPEGEDNREVEGLTKNFTAKQKKNTKVRVYPVYWNASNTHEFGVYRRTANNKVVETPIFTDKQGDDMCQYYSTEQVKKKGGNRFNPVYEDKGWTNFNGSSNYLCWSSSDANNGYISKVRSQGVELLFSEDVVFGFYIKSKGETFYSEASLNNDQSKASFFRASTGGATDAEGETSDFMSGRTFLGFDDLYSDSDNDLNDLVVVFDPEPEIMNEESNYSAVMACEDLGATADYDFNDIVFEVSYTRVDGKTTEINVTPLAAGGTLPAEIYFGNYRIGEIHELLGGNAGSFINTESWKGAGQTISIPSQYVDPNFTITESQAANLGGFNVKVAGKEQIIALPTNKGEAPMMMCLPATWKWPTERTRINIAYPRFGENGGRFMNADWYIKEYTETDMVIVR